MASPSPLVSLATVLVILTTLASGQYQQGTYQQQQQPYQTPNTQQPYQNVQQGYQPATPQQGYPNTQTGYPNTQQGYQNTQTGYPNTQTNYQTQYQQPGPYNNQYVSAANYRCPRPTGTFPVTSDCSSYYSCTNGVATIMKCGPQLAFNPRNGTCDWPYNVPSCQPQQGVLKPMFNGKCNANPNGLRYQPWSVEHPSICNAFFRCVTNYMFARCYFCAPGTYYNPSSRICENLLGRDPKQVCGNRSKFVSALMISSRTASDECWALREPNPLKSISLLPVPPVNNANQYPNTGNAYPTYNTGSQYPNTAGQYPNTNTQYPNTNTQYTNTAGQYPNANTQYPNTAGQYPSANTQYPYNANSQYTNTNTAGQYPSTNTQYTNSQYPSAAGTNTQYPSANTQYPSTNTQYPNSQVPSANAQYPYNANSQVPSANAQYPTNTQYTGQGTASQTGQTGLSG